MPLLLLHVAKVFGELGHYLIYNTHKFTLVYAKFELPRRASTGRSYQNGCYWPQKLLNQYSKQKLQANHQFASQRQTRCRGYPYICANSFSMFRKHPILRRVYYGAVNAT